MRFCYLEKLTSRLSEIMEDPIFHGQAIINSLYSIKQSQLLGFNLIAESGEVNLTLCLENKKERLFRLYPLCATQHPSVQYSFEEAKIGKKKKSSVTVCLIQLSLLESWFEQQYLKYSYYYYLCITLIIE